MPTSSQDTYDGKLYRHRVGQATDKLPAADPVVGTAQKQPAPFTCNVPLQQATTAVSTQPDSAAASTAPQAAHVLEMRQLSECLLRVLRHKIRGADQYPHQLPDLLKEQLFVTRIRDKLAMMPQEVQASYDTTGTASCASSGGTSPSSGGGTAGGGASGGGASGSSPGGYNNQAVAVGSPPLTPSSRFGGSLGEGDGLSVDPRTQLQNLQEELAQLRGQAQDLQAKAKAQSNALALLTPMLAWRDHMAIEALMFAAQRKLAAGQPRVAVGTVAPSGVEQGVAGLASAPTAQGQKETGQQGVRQPCDTIEAQCISRYFTVQHMRDARAGMSGGSRAVYEEVLQRVFPS